MHRRVGACVPYASAGTVVSGAGEFQHQVYESVGCTVAEASQTQYGPLLPIALLALVIVAVCWVPAMGIEGLALPIEGDAPIARPTGDTPVSKLTDYEIANSADDWRELDESEQMDVLEEFVTAESHRLGLSEVPSVAKGRLAEGLLGTYKDGNITISDNLFADAPDGWTTLETAAHEAYHGFQHEAVEGTLTDHVPSELTADEGTADRWRAEFADYKESGPEYWEQEVEKSARAYAADSVERLRRSAEAERAQGGQL